MGIIFDIIDLIFGGSSNTSSSKGSSYNYYLYHFTDISNIPSIKKYGLLSWQELLRRNIYHVPASNELSRELDLKKNLQDYVRLCIQPKHPMADAAVYYGRVKKLVWLKIKPDVMNFRSTLFASDNATSNRAIINHYRSTALNSNSDQAEVLVKNFISTKFILFY